MTSILNLKKINILFTVVFSILIICIAYTKLSNRSIYIWDESIYATNAIELSQHHNGFNSTVNYEKNLYNTKPPLITWLQAISFQILGYKIFSLRLISFISLLLALYALVLIAKIKEINTKENSLFLSSLLVCLFLATPIFMSHHIYLSADMDGPIITISLFLFYLLIKIQYNTIQN